MTGHDDVRAGGPRPPGAPARLGGRGAGTASDGPAGRPFETLEPVAQREGLGLAAPRARALRRAVPCAWAVSPAVERRQGSVQQLVGLALALGEDGSGAVDVGAGARV